MYDSTEILDLLNKKFQEVFVVENSTELPKIEKMYNGKLLGISGEDIKQDDVFDRLERLDVNKAMGPDSVHPHVLKHCACSLAIPLSIIFKESIASGKLPIQWRSSNVTALFKKGDKLETGNYRPVSLTSIPCKILEGIVRKKLEEYFYEHKFLVDEQHGFVRSKSRSTNLLETLDFITSCLANDILIDIPLLDFRKAFDSVIHRGLGVKLDSYGETGYLISWILSFLTDRRQRVVMGDIISVWMEVFSGVPRGSVIGPFLFVVFINDLSRRIKNKLKIYADDTKILSMMRNTDDQKTLQMDLDEALKWSKEWLLVFNIGKCLIMHFGTNNKENQYKIDNKILPKSGSERDLGVVLNRDLKWREQMTVCASKANQMLDMLKKSFIYIDEYAIKRYVKFAISVNKITFKLTQFISSHVQIIKLFV